MSAQEVRLKPDFRERANANDVPVGRLIAVASVMNSSARSKRAMCPASLSLYEARNGVCQSARLRELRMRSCAVPITGTRSAVTYVLLARNKTRPRGFFLPGPVSSRCARPSIAVGHFVVSCGKQ